MNDLLSHQEVVLVLVIHLERQTVKLEIFSKICNEIIDQLFLKGSDAVVQVQGEDLWRFYHGDCETSAGEFYNNFFLSSLANITNRKFHIPNLL